jgi:PAS domain S-box-containing protein
MAPTSPPPSDTPDRPGRRRFAELSRAFWRGITTTHGLGPALEELLDAFNTDLGARRTSVWLHDRRARELSLAASSDPTSAVKGARVASTDPDAPAARGLRLEQPQILEPPSEPILIAPLRGWRRALGTLVIEGPMTYDADRQQQLNVVGDLARQLSVGIENVQLLEEMLLQRRLLEDTFNSLVDLVIVTDQAQRVVQMNDAFALRIGQSRADLIERNLSELVGPELTRWAADGESAPGAPHDAVRSRTIEHAQLGGIFHVTATPLINEDGEPVGTVLVARDITRQTALETEKEALRARLVQSEKLASLGQFVAGIAHEINNPLQGVLGHLELLLWSAPKGQGLPLAEARRPFRKELKLIYNEADRAAQIVRNLLTFTGSQRIRRRRLRIDRVLARALASRRSSMSRACIEVVRQSEDNLPAVVGDQLLLLQAFTNILVNAEHAISYTGQAGTISVSTASPTPEIVRITIQDSGPGMSASVLPRIFDPFFTTKDVGQGTGLGLTLTYGVIQEHGGTIHAVNGPDGGAIFTIDLPAVDGVRQ